VNANRYSSAVICSLLSSFIQLMERHSKEFIRSKTLHGVIMDGRMSFLPHIEAIISKSSRMLGFIKSFSKKFLDLILIKLITKAESRAHRLRLVQSPVRSFGAA
jgi:hypothetical protein